MPNESFVLLALALATKQIPELLVDIPMSRCQKLPVWRRPQRCQISCPSFPNHRASNHPSLRLQAWRWSKQKAYHQYLSVSAITTNQAPYMLQQSCASLVLACQFGIGIVHLSQNIDRRIWPARMRWIPPAQSRSLSSYLIPYFSPIRFSVTEQAWARCQMGQVTVATRYCSTTAFSPILRVEVNPAQLKYQAQGSRITPVATFCAKRGRKRKRVI